MLGAGRPAPHQGSNLNRSVLRRWWEFRRWGVETVQPGAWVTTLTQPLTGPATLYGSRAVRGLRFLQPQMPPLGGTVRWWPRKGSDEVDQTKHREDSRSPATAFPPTRSLLSWTSQFQVSPGVPSAMEKGLRTPQASGSPSSPDSERQSRMVIYSSRVFSGRTAYSP